MSSYSIFIFAHSLLRYFVIILTLVVAVQSVMGMQKKGAFKAGNKKTALFMMIACDLQLLVGLAVFYLGNHLQAIQQGGFMSDHSSRFYNMEHPLSMVIGIVLVHLAYSTAKKAMVDSTKFKRMFWFSFIALVLFVKQTPWPSSKDVGRPWLPGVAMTTTSSPAHA
ncbi:hypothetical protein CJD36_011345 [Flavipsychrobacter stenotrophus]|uniref:Cytochrome B n=1 Tax=Flavipsychrobacter stenotrophus TaxID=2077091 RepID=A0A2S7SUG0_9BACT|nr:hypothetical protein [Flavipsychrobacter stenotrophus]PQJ10562.1 hypothetical protein CJD36_011345 [Flavipsychrobacter stenotrophus]